MKFKNIKSTYKKAWMQPVDQGTGLVEGERECVMIQDDDGRIYQYSPYPYFDWSKKLGIDVSGDLMSLLKTEEFGELNGIEIPPKKPVEHRPRRRYYGF